MTILTQSISIRAKKLGVLIRDSRLSQNKTISECATVLGVTPEVFENYEYGNFSPSLPELELLAYSLNLPIDHFKGTSIISVSSSNVKKNRS